jgi:diguanylate cyclase (GGDEF)-like protein
MSNASGSAKDPQVQALRSQMTELSQFLVRYAGFYEGINQKVDNEMQVLCGHLAAKSNFSMISISIRKIIQLIQKADTSYKKPYRQLLVQSDSTLQSLRANQSVDSKIKNKALDLHKAMTQKAPDATENLSHLGDLLQLFQQIVDESMVKSEPIAQLSADSPTDQSNPAGLDKSQTKAFNQLQQDINYCLQELIYQLSTKKSGPQLEEIQAKLRGDVSQADLLECYLTVIRTLTSDMLLNRKITEDLVFNLHDTLQTTNVSIQSSLETTQQHFANNKLSTQNLGTQLEDIELTMSKNDLLDEIKSHTEELVEKMTHSIMKRQEEDEEEQKVLMGLLDEMQSQLVLLENETSRSHKELVEQRLLSQQDPLTHLPNRSAYEEYIRTEYENWSKTNVPLTIAILDIDFFKKINDNYGHMGGDKTLQVIAQHTQKNLRHKDFLARWGGEEFVIVMPETTLENARKPLESIRQQIERLPFKFKGTRVTVTTSIGASAFRAGDDIASVFERTDRALYQAKSQGRNRCVYI